MHIFRVFSQADIWDQRVHRRHLWSSVDQCTLTDTLYQPSMNSQLIVDGHLWNWHSINDWLTSQWAVGWELTNCPLIHTSWSTLSQLTIHEVLIDGQSSVNLVSAEYRLRCWSSVNQDDDQGSIEGIDWHPTANVLSTRYNICRMHVPRNHCL